MPKVYALTDKAKKLWHVPGGYKFNADGVSDWPYDQFTKRRIRDGDISLEPPQQREGQKAEREEPHSRRRLRDQSQTSQDASTTTS